MSRAIAQKSAAPPSRKPGGNFAVTALLAPAILLLLFAFFAPLVWFFTKSVGAIGTPSEIVDEISFVLTSPVVMRAGLFTLFISTLVTISCLILAYPISYALVRVKGLVFSILMVCVILPYFISTVVRTYAWMVLLGRNGILNQFLMDVGFASEPLKIMYSVPAIVIGMVYVLVPYMVLTLYASMKSIDIRLLRAAEGMGASGFYTFRKIFFPLTMPGVVSGSLIIFILALGFFVTPALMGGPSHVTIAMLIEREVEINLNWGMASIVSMLLLSVTLALYTVYYRFARIDKMLK